MDSPASLSTSSAEATPLLTQRRIFADLAAPHADDDNRVVLDVVVEVIGRGLQATTTVSDAIELCVDGRTHRVLQGSSRSLFEELAEQPRGGTVLVPPDLKLKKLNGPSGAMTSFMLGACVRAPRRG